MLGYNDDVLGYDPQKFASNRYACFLGPVKLQEFAPNLAYASLTQNLIRISFSETCPHDPFFCALDFTGNHIESLDGLFAANNLPTWCNFSDNMLFEVSFPGTVL